MGGFAGEIGRVDLGAGKVGRCGRRCKLVQQLLPCHEKSNLQVQCFFDAAVAVLALDLLAADFSNFNVVAIVELADEGLELAARQGRGQGAVGHFGPLEKGLLGQVVDQLSKSLLPGLLAVVIPAFARDRPLVAEFQKVGITGAELAEAEFGYGKA